MCKYLSLIIFLGLFFINCGEPPKRPSGTVSESLEVLKIDRKIKDVGADIYEMDLFYKGEMTAEALVDFVKRINDQYDDLTLNVWISKKSYDNSFGLIDGSRDTSFIIEARKKFPTTNYMKWTQIYGEFSDLYGKKVVFDFHGKVDEPVAKVDESKRVQKGTIVYVTTNYNCRILPDPDSNNELTRIPKNTVLEVLESKDVQQGRMLNKWYKVTYNGITGWTSGWNMKEEPELRVLSVEEMNENYKYKIGEKPKNNPLTGKIPEVDRWLKKNKNNYNSIKYRQWYEPFAQNNRWVCRVLYDEEISGITISSDMLFYILNGEVIDFSDKNY